MHTMQAKSWKYILQISENHNIIQKLTNQQNVSKNENPFNIRLNYYMKSVKDPKEILADKHFQNSGHRFNENSLFTKTDRFTKTNLDKEILRERLLEREKFWI